MSFILFKKNYCLSIFDPFNVSFIVYSITVIKVIVSSNIISLHMSFYVVQRADVLFTFFTDLMSSILFLKKRVV